MFSKLKRLGVECVWYGNILSSGCSGLGWSEMGWYDFRISIVRRVVILSTKVS